jgi:DNA-binding response OmpR family regulator
MHVTHQKDIGLIILAPVFCYKINNRTMQKKILLADETNHLLSELKTSLESTNYRVVSASNGLQTLQLFTSETPDLVLLDLQMPGVNGKGLLHQIREIDLCTPIIVLLPATKEHKSSLIDAIDVGVTMHLHRPIDLDILLALINCALGDGKMCGRFLHKGHVYQLEKNRLEMGNQCIRLKDSEFLVIEALLKFKQGVVSSDYLMKRIWGTLNPGNKKSLFNILSAIRKKLRVFPDLVIITGFNKGYSLTINGKSD